MLAEEFHLLNLPSKHRDASLLADKNLVVLTGKQPEWQTQFGYYLPQWYAASS